MVRTLSICRKRSPANCTCRVRHRLLHHGRKQHRHHQYAPSLLRPTRETFSDLLEPASPWRHHASRPVRALIALRPRDACIDWRRRCGSTGPSRSASPTSSGATSASSSSASTARGASSGSAPPRRSTRARSCETCSKALRTSSITRGSKFTGGAGPDDVLRSGSVLSKDLIYSAYGLKTGSHDDPLIETVEHGLEATLAAMIPGRFLVDAFPIREWQTFDVVE